MSFTTSKKLQLILFLIILIGCGISQKVRKTISEEDLEKCKTCKEYYDAGSECFKRGMIDNALIYLEKAVECSIKFVDAYMLLGDAYYECEKYSKALEQYMIIESDLSEYATINVKKGNCYKRLKEYSKSAEEYLKAIEKSENKLIPYYYLINMYLIIKDYGNAEKYIKQAFEIAPNDPGLNCMMGDVYMGYGDKVRAQKHYKAAMSHYKTSKEWYKKSVDDAEWDYYARLGIRRVDSKIKNTLIFYWH